MHRKCEVIRNEGIEGVLPTTGRNPSSTAKLGLAANADVERSDVERNMYNMHNMHLLKYAEYA